MLSRLCNMVPTSFHGSSALPVVFIHELQNLECDEGGSATLSCELSKPGVPVQWKKGSHVIQSEGKYVIRQFASKVELKITDLKPEDEGDYTCVCGDKATTANMKIKGMNYSYYFWDFLTINYSPHPSCTILTNN